MTVQPGAQVVIGRQLDQTLNGGVPVAYTWGTATLRNDDGRIGLRLGETIVDEAPYGSSQDGRSFSLDPAATDAAANDDPSSWCLGDPPFGTAGGRGTPGAVNPACGTVSCDDGGTVRPAVLPAAGDLVVTEVYANTPGRDDALKQWIEVSVRSPVDLVGLRVASLSGSGSTRAATLGGPQCRRVAAGTLVVLGASAEAAVNGGVPVTFTWSPAIDLYNSGGARLEAGGATVDEAAHPDVPEAVSVGVPPALASDPHGNDAASSWCAARSTGRFEGTGTPGVANDPCP